MAPSEFSMLKIKTSIKYFENALFKYITYCHSIIISGGAGYVVSEADTEPECQQGGKFDLC